MSRLTEGGSVDTLAGPPPPPPGDASHGGLGGECGAGFEAGGPSRQQELIPRNMFLTRTHRRGNRVLAPPA